MPKTAAMISSLNDGGNVLMSKTPPFPAGFFCFIMIYQR